MKNKIFLFIISIGIIGCGSGYSITQYTENKIIYKCYKQHKGFFERDEVLAVCDIKDDCNHICDNFRQTEGYDEK